MARLSVSVTPGSAPARSTAWLTRRSGEDGAFHQLGPTFSLTAECVYDRSPPPADSVLGSVSEGGGQEYHNFLSPLYQTARLRSNCYEGRRYFPKALCISGLYDLGLVLL